MVENIKLDRLKQGFYGVSPVVGNAHYEACLVCLDNQQHESPMPLKVGGIQTTEFDIEWRDTISSQARRSWHDLTVATEWAACGIAMLLTVSLFDFEIARQSKKGNGFDYWIGKRDPKTLNMQEFAQLEVSGILSASSTSVITTRVKQKHERVKASRLPTYIIVVEFSRPLAWVDSK